jgi:TM2 domain-containing membrane protein YozV
LKVSDYKFDKKKTSKMPIIYKEGQMFCTNCSNSVAPNAMACTKCGLSPKTAKKFCYNCGAERNPAQIMCVKCGVSLAGGGSNSSGNNNPKSKTVAGILAIMVGGPFGAHKFYLGYITEGIIMALTFWIGCFLIIPTMIICGIAFIEGVLYLTKSEEDFQQIYVQNKKGWF